MICLILFTCLVTYFKIEHQHQTFMSLFSSITDINGFFKIPTHPPPTFILTHTFLKFNKSPTSPFILTPTFIRHLRVISVHEITGTWREGLNLSFYGHPYLYLLFESPLLLPPFFGHIAPMKYGINTKKVMTENNFFMFRRLQKILHAFFL